MPLPTCSDEELIELVRTLGVIGTSRKLAISERSVHGRKRRLEARLGIKITPPIQNNPISRLGADRSEHPHRIQERITDGVVLVGSDAHYYPGIITTAHKVFVKFAREFKPTIIIKNGDELDFPSISRFTPIGWEKRPKVQEEIEWTQERMAEIESASLNSKLIWSLGNHDARFETRLATVAPEYAMVKGVHLHDHFPRWKGCWATWLNDDVVVKHRYKSGIYATRNNALNSGKTVVTGHLHSLQVTPLSDYNGTRWGVDCGTMADVYGPMFTDYMEDSPRNWRSGFVLLTFHKSRLLWPEIIHITGENEYEFRGKLYQLQ